MNDSSAFCAACGTRNIPGVATKTLPSDVWPLHNSLAIWSEPAEPHNLVAKADRGTRLRVLAHSTGHYQVALPTEQVGYIGDSLVSEREAPVEFASSGAPRPADHRQASFGHRVGGTIVDAVINAIGAGVLSVGLYAALLPDRYTQAELDNVQASVTLIVSGLFLLYRWLANSFGGTLGKLIVGLRVVDDSSREAPGLGSGFIRTLVSIGSALALGLGYLSAAWDDEGKTWHDHVANTIVVSKR